MTTCTVMRRDLAALEKPTVPFPFPSLPDEALNRKASEVASSLRLVVDTLILRALESNTAEEFQRTRNSDFREFCLFSKALSEFVKTNTNPLLGAQLALQVLRSNEQGFRLSAPAVIGFDACNKALFYFVTLRKTFELVSELVQKEMHSELDRAAARQCAHAVLWAGYHYECMLAIAQKRIVVNADVLNEVLESLAVVDIAYTAAKTGHLLRFPDRHLHKVQTQPSDQLFVGSVDEIVRDALTEFSDWAPSRDRANRETIPQ